MLHYSAIARSAGRWANEGVGRAEAMMRCRSGRRMQMEGRGREVFGSWVSEQGSRVCRVGCL